MHGPPYIHCLNGEKWPRRRPAPAARERKEMDSPETNNWVFNCGFVHDLPLPCGDFPAPDVAPAFYWPTHNTIDDFSVEIGGSCEELVSDLIKTPGTRKRQRSEFFSGSESKACREKKRRDMINDRFLELAAIIDPEKPSKMDRAAILNDAVRLVTQMRSEADKLKESNDNLQEKIKELKTEKNELRDEKQRLKAEKEQLEQQLKKTSATQPGFLPNASAITAAFAAQSQAAGNKLLPFIGYPGVAMWQFMPPAVVDISQDHILRPPVA